MSVHFDVAYLAVGARTIKSAFGKSLTIFNHRKSLTDDKGSAEVCWSFILNFYVAYLMRVTSRKVKRGRLPTLRYRVMAGCITCRGGISVRVRSGFREKEGDGLIAVSWKMISRKGGVMN